MDPPDHSRDSGFAKKTGLLRRSANQYQELRCAPQAAVQRQRRHMASVLETRPAATALADATDHTSHGGWAAPPAPTDGFHLVIDALKLNDIDTIFGLPGIPITDLTRMAQAQGMRVISFRHEQHAGNAPAAAGFLTQ